MCFWYNYHSNTLFSWFIYLGNYLHFLHPGKLFFDLCKKGHVYFLGGTECERFGFRGQLYEVIRASTFSKSGEKSWTFCLKVCGFHSINLFYYGKSSKSWTTKQGFAGTVNYKYLLICCFVSFLNFTYKTSTLCEGSMNWTKQCLVRFYEG